MSINNPSLEQLKKAEISHQVLMNEPSCFDLTANQEITEWGNWFNPEASQREQDIIIQNELEKPRKASSPEECQRILQAALAACSFSGPFAPACIAYVC